jgi:hypothetical protein
MKILIAATCLLALAARSAAADDREECPEAFRGAVVRAQTQPGGVSLEFRNGNRASVQDMRDQLRAVADMLEEHGTERMTSGEEDDEVDFPPVAIEVKDIVLGARVSVRATRLRDITPIRELAFGFAEYWKTSVCYEPLLSAR